MAIEINFTFQGWAEADAFLGRLENALKDLSGAFGLVRNEVQNEIGLLFRDNGAGRTNPWGGWAPWTTEWRYRPPVFMEPPPENAVYYVLRSPSGEDSIGVWSGEMRRAFAGESAPGYTRTNSNSLEIGLQIGKGSADVKYNVFLEGRKKEVGRNNYYALFRALFEGHTYNWGIRGAGKSLESNWTTHPQPARAIYENLNLELDDSRNPIARGFRAWFQQEFNLLESP